MIDIHACAEVEIIYIFLNRRAPVQHVHHLTLGDHVSRGAATDVLALRSHGDISSNARRSRGVDAARQRPLAAVLGGRPMGAFQAAHRDGSASSQVHSNSDPACRRTPVYTRRFGRVHQLGVVGCAAAESEGE